MITARTRKTDHGYTGYIQIKDGSMRRSEGTHITRLSKADALKDAERLKKDVICTNKNA